MKRTVTESECLGCRRMAICVYLISGRHFTSAIADEETGRCLKRHGTADPETEESLVDALYDKDEKRMHAP